MEEIIWGFLWSARKQEKKRKLFAVIIQGFALRRMPNDKMDIEREMRQRKEI